MKTKNSVTSFSSSTWSKVMCGCQVSMEWKYRHNERMVTKSQKVSAWRDGSKTSCSVKPVQYVNARCLCHYKAREERKPGPREVRENNKAWRKTINHKRRTKNRVAILCSDYYEKYPGKQATPLLLLIPCPALPCLELSHRTPAQLCVPCLALLPWISLLLLTLAQTSASHLALVLTTLNLYSPSSVGAT